MPINDFTITKVITDASSVLWDTLNRRFTKDEMLSWANMVLNDCAALLGYQKKTVSVLGSSYLTAYGTTPQLYELPQDFIMLAKDTGITTNGLRRLPTTGSEIDLFQEKVLRWQISKNSNKVITIDNYFTQSFTGLIFHYVIDFMQIDQIEAGHTGKYFWLVPNPQPTDVIAYSYIAYPTPYTLTGSTVGTNVPNMMQHTGKIITLGVIQWACYKLYIGSNIGQDVYQTAKTEYEMAKADAKKFYQDWNKESDYMPRVKTAKQVYGMYNSRRRHRDGRQRGYLSGDV